MIHHRTIGEVRKFDLFKLIITLVLLALLIFFWFFRPAGGQEMAETTPAGQPEASQPEPSAPDIIATATLAPATPAVQAAEPTADAVKAAPTIAEPTAASFTSPSVDMPGQAITAGESISLSGSGQPGSAVEVLVNRQVIGQAIVDSSGRWALDAALAEAGQLVVSVQAVDAAGAVLAQSAETDLTVVEPKPAVVAPAATAAGQAITPVEPEVLTIVFPKDGVDVLVGELTLTGSGEPGRNVEILNDGDVFGAATAVDTGEWRFTFEPEAGLYRFAARPPGSLAVPEQPVTVRVVSLAEAVDCASNPGLDRGNTYLVGTCDTLGVVMERTGVTFSNLLAANPQLETPDLIYPGELINIP
jgi:hypothetical protein